MPDAKTISRFAPFVTMVAVLGSLIGWYFVPDRALTWAGHILILPVAWGLCYLAQRGCYRRSDTVDLARTTTAAAMTYTGLVVIALLVLILAQTTGAISAMIADRVEHVIWGGIMLVLGNYIPKRLRPLGHSQHGPMLGPDNQRFVGWTFVAAGLAYILAWCFLPYATAPHVGGVISGIAIIVVLGRWSLSKPDAGQT